LSSTTPAKTLSVQLTIGRLRRLQAVTVAIVGCVGGWLWLGNSGAALLGLWAWSLWPRWQERRVTVNVASLRLVRLSANRVLWVERPLRTRQIFADELSSAQYAALRRELKAAVVA